MERILNMNNEGVEYFLAGNYRAAKKSLRTALMYLKEFHEECQRLRLLRSIENQISLIKDAPHHSFGDLILQFRRVPDSLNEKSCSQQHYIYRNAIFAFLDLTQKKGISTPQVQNSSGLAAMIIFNMSLVYHYHAECYNSTKNLRNVLSLYKKSLEALKAAPWFSHKSYNTMVLLGILNNMGAIFYDLAKYKNARDCFKALQKMFKTSKDHVVDLEAGAYRGMMMNALFLDQLKTAPVA
mmetsp:Transcript_10652/g.15674  ORF Transcript_10652/g.15674 Transcript_10652/m.15674 type:complete len:239 (+) Transcript_10652:72-788(+)